MPYILNTWRDPYGEGFNICRKKQIELKEGLTILVGCNGCGKTTMLNNLKSQLETEKIPCYYFDNLSSGGSMSISEALFNGDLEFGASALCSSEGERIRLNVGRIVASLRAFLKNGQTPEQNTRPNNKVNTMGRRNTRSTYHGR